MRREKVDLGFWDRVSLTCGCSCHRWCVQCGIMCMRIVWFVVGFRWLSISAVCCYGGGDGGGVSSGIGSWITCIISIVMLVDRHCRCARYTVGGTAIDYLIIIRNGHNRWIDNQQLYFICYRFDTLHYLLVCFIANVYAIHLNDSITLFQTGRFSWWIIIHFANILAGFTFFCVQIETVTIKIGTFHYMT